MKVVANIFNVDDVNIALAPCCNASVGDDDKIDAIIRDVRTHSATEVVARTDGGRKRFRRSFS